MPKLNAIYNANVYIDGNNLLGKAAEITAPEIEFTMDEVTGLGLFGTIKLPSGMEALEAEVTWNSFYPEVAARSRNPFKSAQLMIRSNLQTFDAAGLEKEVPMVTTMTGTFGKDALGGFKPKEKAEFSSTFQVNEVRQVADGRELFYYNAFTNTLRVAGQDVLSQMRKNIGA
ncbi:phage major tail tube protein [Uruburuella testudinis]|uniref:Phage major tail tube protein n=1 Tax=Uruburuella testudinis TaxID=1282863 RepID=A0ABY4DVN2_9NEIS|nr:phage major tail tube protein [Uruburuella testudinis]UOO82769.1 phage major tail tube protein [Uruburuella testudinis]